jgi:uncharacterized membrane protein
MIDFIKTYFWDYMWQHQGYNPYNTFVYALIALVSLFFVYKWLKHDYKINRKFMFTLITFILFGSTFRVVVDCYDSFHGISRAQQYIMSNAMLAPVYELIGSLHVYDYSVLTVSPGIYIIIALLFFVALLIEKKFGLHAWKTGLLLWVIHLLLLLPLIVYPVYPILIILLAGGVTCIIYFLLKPGDYILAVFAHALDGAATFIIIDVFTMFEHVRRYSEQHFLPTLIGENYGYVAFFALKVLIATIAVKIIMDDKSISKDDALFFIAVLMTIGLAPGIRNLLRIMTGA